MKSIYIRMIIQIIFAGSFLFSFQSLNALWPESAFTAKNVADAMGNLFGTADNTPSSKIKIEMPGSVDVGDRVPVKVSTAMAASDIAVLVEGNAQPLSANFNMGGSSKGTVAFNLKICGVSSTDVIAVVKSGGKLYTARKNIKITSSDCTRYGPGRNITGGKSIQFRRAHVSGTDAYVKTKILHPFETGLRIDPLTGSTVPAHYITEMKGEHKGTTIIIAQWGPGVSGNPFFSFVFSGAYSGDIVKLTWVDNKGKSDSSEVKLK